MTKYLTVFASFMIMLSLGGIYAWSIIASELIKNYNFSVLQTQSIFGTVIAVFPFTMVIMGLINKSISPRILGAFSAIFFLSGYIIAGSAAGSYIYTLIGLGGLVGIGTGIGYWVSITIPVQWFPNQKGLITGIAAAGFGLGAIFMSSIVENILLHNIDISRIFIIVGVSYSIIILLFSNLIRRKPKCTSVYTLKINELYKSISFYKLIIGILLGTFAGLLVIGNLKLIGELNNITNHILIISISFFAFANFLGRLFWGYISDFINTSKVIFISLLIQSTAILSLIIIPLTDYVFLSIAFCIGLGFGGNFVLFAKETAQKFGINNLGKVYPHIFLGYAVAGILGPITGGLLFEFSGNYNIAILTASIISLIGAILFFFKHINILKL